MMTILPREASDFADPRTGVTVRQLTNYSGHSHHFYFTNPGWWDGGQRLLVSSDRNNVTGLYSVHLESGELTRYTAHEDQESFIFSALNPTRPEVYLWRAKGLYGVNLESGEERFIWAFPGDFGGTMMNITADGKYACFSLVEGDTRATTKGMLAGYKGFGQRFEARPLSQIHRVDLETGKAEVIYAENAWIGHVNTSPTQPNVLTFCHEGPWTRVQQRIWRLDLETGEAAPVRPQLPEESIGHEYWFADGLHIGYHGHTPEGPVFGYSRDDNSSCTEIPFPHDSNHFHSNGAEWLVGDGPGRTNFVLLWRFDGDGYDGPRILCRHRSSRHVQQLHVHPRFSPDGKKVVFTSDMNGYGQVYEVEIPDWQSLPTV